MLDKEFHPYLLEVNTNPGLHMLTDVVRPHHTSAQLDLLKVVLDNRDKWQQPTIMEQTLQPQYFGKWKLIFRDTVRTPNAKKPNAGQLYSNKRKQFGV